MGKPFTHYYNEILIFVKDGEARPKPFTHYYNEILIFLKDGEAMLSDFLKIGSSCPSRPKLGLRVLFLYRLSMQCTFNLTSVQPFRDPAGPQTANAYEADPSSHIYVRSASARP